MACAGTERGFPEQMPRLFAAITPPETVRAELVGLRRDIDGVSWIRPEQIHMTLRFVGERDDAATEAIRDSLATVRVEPFILEAKAVGVFPPRGRPKVLWAGLGRAHTRLFQLRQRVDDALLRVASDIDVRTFHPHLTLGRIRETADEKAVARFIKCHESFESPPFRVHSFHLYRSDLNAGGPVYTVVQAYSLTA